MSLRPRLVCLAAVIATATASVAVADHCCCCPGAPAVLVVYVRAGALVELEGIPVRSTGPVRRLESPPLPPGQAFVYSVAATWDDGRGPITIERDVAVLAGQEVLVDLRPQALLARLRPAPEPPRPARRAEAPRSRPRSQVQYLPEPRPAQRVYTSRTDGLSARERELLDLTNAERRRAGLPALAPDATLMRLARGHASEMARQQRMDHTLNGTTFDERLSASGYPHRLAAENIAQGPATPREAVALWMNSPAHRANLLHPDHREIGLGLATSSTGEPYYAQVFAAPSAY